MLVGLLCKPIGAICGVLSNILWWGKKLLALVPYTTEVEVKSQSFTIAVEMSWWDHSGPASGQGNRKLGVCFLPAGRPHHSSGIRYETGWDGWDFAVAIAVGKLHNQQRLCLWKSAWGSLLGLCWVSTSQFLVRKNRFVFFLPPFFFSIFLSFYFPLCLIISCVSLSIYQSKVYGEEKKNKTGNSPCCYFSIPVPSTWYIFFFSAFRFILLLSVKYF